MRNWFLVLATAAALAFSATPAFLQESGKPHAQHEHGATAGGMMQQGGMMCPMMGSEGMGMMGNMTGGMSSGNPKTMAQMMLMRGEMMMKMGEVMMKHAKMLQQEQTR